jgi:hypothetical protein
MAVLSYHEQGPDSVVDEDGGCCDEHAKAYETVKLGHWSVESTHTFPML